MNVYAQLAKEGSEFCVTSNGVTRHTSGDKNLLKNLIKPIIIIIIIIIIIMMIIITKIS